MSCIIFILQIRKQFQFALAPLVESWWRILSAGEESTCNAGDPISIPRLGRSAGEGIGYPLQYSWASLVIQLVKNLPAMWETWVQSLGSIPGEGNGYPLQYFGLENLMDCIAHGVAKSQTQQSEFHFHFSICLSNLPNVIH